MTRNILILVAVAAIAYWVGMKGMVRLPAPPPA